MIHETPKRNWPDLTFDQERQLLILERVVYLHLIDPPSWEEMTVRFVRPGHQGYEQLQNVKVNRTFSAEEIKSLQEKLSRLLYKSLKLNEKAERLAREIILEEH